MDERLTLSVLNISSSARFEKHAFSAGEDALSSYGRPGIFNSDQGSQYTAQGFINTLVKHKISISMDSKDIFFYAFCKACLCSKRIWLTTTSLLKGSGERLSMKTSTPRLTPA